MRTALLGGLAVLAFWGAATATGQTHDKKLPPSDAEKPWSFISPKRPVPPSPNGKNWVRNPIDAFILAAMEKQAVKPAAEADRVTLIRRLTFDLTGLPPTPDEVAAFLGDKSADAYEKVVDRLLLSSAYGERWALYWLDLVRFAESDGFKADDPRPLAWRYRDYVIDAFNQDKPYDRFIQEQLAGDELFPGDPVAFIATGFSRNCPTEHNAKNIELHRQEILNDITDATGLVFLGLTIGCAKCHDHKYDPILQTDYFRLQAFFAGFRMQDDRVVAPITEQEAFRQKMQVWTQRTAEIQKKIAEVEQPYRQKLVNENKVKYDKFLQDSYDMPASERTPLQQQMAEMFALQLKVDRTAMSKSMQTSVKGQWEELTKELAKFDQLKPSPLPMAMGLTEVGPASPPTFVLQRGDYKKKGAEVQPGFPAIFDREPAVIPTPSADAKTTGRRSALAKWLTRPDHPLTARVMVNRLWQHHFGRGIVGTASDFGVIGDQPTHPELLDWLATEFVRQGWSLKKMHRLMVTSATYRQSSQPEASSEKADAENQLFSRMSRRRLEGEALRDAMLSVSGLLQFKAGGPGVFPPLPEELGVPKGKWPVTADVSEHNRRSIYVFAKRNLRYPLFGAFDAPEGNESCALRNRSISAPQALMLMNGKMTLGWAQAFAGRALHEAGTEPDRLVSRLYLLAFGRAPTAAEAKLSRDFLTAQTDEAKKRLAERRDVLGPTGGPAGGDPALGAAVVDLSHVMLNLNEFAYVD